MKDLVGRRGRDPTGPRTARRGPPDGRCRRGAPAATPRGADEVVAPPHAAAMTAMLARMPKRRFCMGSPPNGLLPDDSRYRGPPHISTPLRLSRSVRIEPPARFGRWASSGASTDRVGALPVLSTALRRTVNSRPNKRSVGWSARRCQSGHGVSAPVIGAPAQVRLAGGRRLVQAADRGAVRGARDEVRGRLGLAGDRDQGVGEGVERLDRFGLGRLDQHPLLDDQREVDRRRVVAVVDEALGDVEGPDAGPLLDGRRRRDELVLAGAVVRDVVASRPADA